MTKRTYTSPAIALLAIGAEHSVLAASEERAWYGWLFSSSSRTTTDTPDCAAKDSVGAVQKPYLWD